MANSNKSQQALDSGSKDDLRRRKIEIIICDSETEAEMEYRQKVMVLAEQQAIAAEIFEYKNVHNLYYDFTDGILCADIIIIDIKLCGENSIQTVLELREAGYRNEIIVLTASEDESDILSGYDIEALHYLIKNKTGDKKLKKIFYKAVKKIEKRNEELLTFTCAGESRTIPINDILYFEVEHRIVTVHFDDENNFSFYTPLEQIEKTLCGKGFVRNYRSQIVSVRKIKSYSFERIVLDNGV